MGAYVKKFHMSSSGHPGKIRKPSILKLKIRTWLKKFSAKHSHKQEFFIMILTSDSLENPVMNLKTAFELNLEISVDHTDAIAYCIWATVMSSVKSVSNSVISLENDWTHPAINCKEIWYIYCMVEAVYFDPVRCFVIMMKSLHMEKMCYTAINVKKLPHTVSYCKSSPSSPYLASHCGGKLFFLKTTRQHPHLSQVLWISVPSVHIVCVLCFCVLIYECMLMYERETVNFQ